jgi:hypothetical protein
MLAREQLLGMGEIDRPYGLVYPVVFSDGTTFPEIARATQSRNLTEWNYPRPQFCQATTYLDFEREMQRIAEELALLLPRAPAYRDDWPVVLPAAYPMSTPTLPRLT